MPCVKSISIRQPWAWLIVQGWKDVENRSRRTKYRGPVLIHASKTQDFDGYKDPKVLRIMNGLTLLLNIKYFGGIIGMADIVDCVDDSDSKWFTGPHGLVLANPKVIPYHPCRGQLGLFTVDYPYQLPAINQIYVQKDYYCRHLFTFSNGSNES